MDKDQPGGGRPDAVRRPGRAAKKAGFDTGKSFQFKPFTPRLAQPLGAFHSFAG